MKLKDWVEVNKKTFGECDLRFLIKNVFKVNSWPAIEREIYLDSQSLKYLNEIKELCDTGMPLAYILGKEEFFGLEFKVNSDVLIPRPETELIVEKAIDIINQNNLQSILDLGCGSGNIAISIKKRIFQETSVFASDISFSATKMARGNAEFNNASIRLVNADLLGAFKQESFDLIISNPPYVEEANIKGSLAFEPKVALSAGKNGLYFIDKILKQAKDYLKSGGYFIMEIGYKHRGPVDNFIHNSDSYKIVEWIKDYSGYFRGVILTKNG
ncbi:MAG: peptide chain release factor N(5)-glutamine methyltransferase [Candidatus Omnitrophota bacterium]